MPIALRQLVSEEAVTAVPLIGDHSGNGKDGSSAGHLDERAPVLFKAVREIVERWPQPPDPIAGRSLSDLQKKLSVRPVRRNSRREALRNLLHKVGGKRKSYGRMRARQDGRIIVDSPVPGFDRRSIVLASLGARPLLYAQSMAAGLPRWMGEKVHVYLDVSGSIGDLKGALYGAVLDCREFVYKRVHLFSTEVADLTVEELRQGVCKTTGGTSIACVAKHMRENSVRRAVLITDGYVGKVYGQNLKTLKDARLGVALMPGSSSRGDLEQVADYFIDLTDGHEQGGN